MMENEKFTYTYSAQKDAAANPTRRPYFSGQNSEALEKLRQLDRKISSPGTAAGIAVGVVGTLVFGLGLSCVMVWDRLILGSLIGIVGIAGIAAAYPVFDRITKKQREKYAAELARLTRALGKK